MPTLLVRDVLWRVSDLLQDTSPQFGRYPEAKLVRYLNDGQVSVVKFIPTAGARNDAIRLVPGTAQSIETIQPADCKPLTGLAPSAAVRGVMLQKVMHNMGADGLTAGRAIRLVDQDAIDSQDRDWHSKASSPVTSYVFDPRDPLVFYVNPGVPASGWWVRASYAALPSVIPAGGAPGAETYGNAGSSTTTISIPDEYADELVNYTCARALMEESSFADKGSAAAFAALFMGAVNAKVLALTGKNPNLQRLPLVANPDGQAS